MVGMFISVTGIDGAGKTTIARLLSDRLTAGSAWCNSACRRCVVPPGHPARAMARNVVQALWGPYETVAMQYAGDLFWSHITHAWYSLASRVVGERLTRGESLVMGDWYEKIYARFLCKPQVPRAFTDSVEDLFIPTVTVMLDLDPASAATRKASPKPTEQGALDPWLHQVSFEEYQGLVREQLLRLARERNWLVVPGEGAPADIVDEIVSHPELCRLVSEQTGNTGRGMGRQDDCQCCGSIRSIAGGD